ncbi:hypothetical protein ACIQF6_35910 [Kitasatospora sp. NPDC092948]|uniref:hypothetical protein n=1 Tax=Kitasatospora sp. NPDC092948 TaxID=3364088 RepID=UPI0037FC4BB0
MPTTPDALHWIGCPCDGCRLMGTSRPLDQADDADLVGLLTGTLRGGTRQPVRLRLEVEIPSGGRSLAEARPERVTVLAVGADGEAVCLRSGELDPYLLRSLSSLLNRD